jgi:plastocyanin
MASDRSTRSPHGREPVYSSGVWLLRLFLSLVLGAAGTVRGTVSIRKKDGAPREDRSEVVVYLADVAGGGDGARAEIRQRGLQFLPRVLAVAAGTEVRFPNEDGVEHNVFCHSANADFDLGRFGPGRGRAQRFERAGVAEVFCNVHKQMVAYVVVAPGPAFAVTGPDGRFEIRGVPPGRHRLAVWERFARPRVQELAVDVPAGGVATVDREVQEVIDVDPPHRNKFGVEYQPGYH